MKKKETKFPKRVGINISGDGMTLVNTSEELRLRLEAYSEKTGFTFSSVLRIALSEYLDRELKKQND